MGRALTHVEARRVYDRIGIRQDTQAFYEDAAIEALIAHSDFGHARDVVEFGCGTGRLAASLLEQELPRDARYVGVDLSPVMVEIASKRLARFGGRAVVVRTDGSSALPVPDGAFQRFVSTYVLDLLSERQIGELIAEAHRVLEPGGRIGLVSLACGFTRITRFVEGLWRRVHALNPALVGGCRPLELAPFLPATHWTVLHHERLALFGIPSEVLVAASHRASSSATESTV